MILRIGGHKIRVPFTVNHAVIVDDRVVVCYESTEVPDDSEYAGRNIECLTFEGKRIWLIPTSTAWTRPDGAKQMDGYFSVYIADDGALQCCDPLFISDLDPATGAASNIRINR